MTSVPRPPRLARFILERALPSDVREDVSGDIEELFRRRSVADPLRARLWYWRQAFSFTARFRAERLRNAPGHIDMSTRFSWMDVKLAARILVRYPGLTAVGVLGMAVAIAIAAGAFGIIYTLLDPALPLDEGHRIVMIQNWDLAENSAERRILHDFAEWRDELTSVQDVGAYRHVSRNLIAPGAQPETVRVTEMSPSGFRVARVAPMLGRFLLEADERPSAPPVVVIAAEVWRNRFVSDPGIVGRLVQLGATSYSIVGVMPDGFAFPVNDRLWTPLRLNPGLYPRRSGPSISVFGRLAPGATFESAQAELAILGQRSATAFPQTHDKLRPKVMPFTYPFFDQNDPAAAWMAHLLQLLISLLLVVVSVNVAVLVYARTATRHGEIAIRSALGASRGRIVVQLFTEALVLACAAAVVGLALTSFSLRLVTDAMRQVYAGMPFWWNFRMSSGIVLYVVALTIVAAAIVGILPALQATGRRVQTGLKRISAGGGSGMQFGKTWTVLIVLQVAIAVALLPAAVFHSWDSLRYGLSDPGAGAEEFLTAQLLMERANAPVPTSDSYEREFAARYSDRFTELMRRVESEPGVAAFTFSSSVPGSEATVWIEADGVRSPATDDESGGWVATGTRAGHQARFNRVAPNFFEAFDIPLLVGRALTAADADPADPRQGTGAAGEGVVVVNQSFVRSVFGGSTALGRRVRYVGASNDAEPGEVTIGRWYQIVGVVGDFPVNPTTSGLVPAKLYHAVPQSGLHGASIAVRVQGSAAGDFAGRLREMAATVDPNLQVRNVATLDDVLRQEQGLLRIVAAALVVLTLSVLLLSSAGIYALMSFTVAQRRKEIGIRAALGADPGQIFRSIFSRALWQMAAGAVVGVAVAALLEAATDGGLMSGNGTVVLPIVAALVMTVGLLATIGPARRGLRVHPTEALRAE